MHFYQLLAPIAILFCLSQPAAHAGLKEGIEATKAKNYALGFQEIQPAAVAGSPLAQRYMGYYFALAWNKERDFARSFDWFVRASDANDADAQSRLALYYFNGNAGPERDCNKGRELARKAAQAEVVLGFQALSRSYQSDVCGDKNLQEALKWSLRAAERDDPGSQYLVGTQYWQAKGVKRDFDEAHKWFMRAAKQGNGAAMASLGMMYLGDGRPRDVVTAATWLKLADKAGIVDDQKPRLVSTLKSVQTQLNEDQRNEVERRISEFKPHLLWEEGTEREWQKDLQEAARWDAARSVSEPAKPVMK